MKKTMVGALLVVLFATSCMYDKFDNREATGLGPDLTWDHVAFSGTTEWATEGDRAVFEVVRQSAGLFEIRDDMRIPTTPLATGDQHASVDIVDQSTTGVEDGHIWMSTLLGVRIEPGAEPVNGYRGYVAEVVVTNYNLVVPEGVNPLTVDHLDWTYGILILYRANPNMLYQEEHVAATAAIYPDFSSPQRFTLEADGNTVTTTFAGHTLQVADVCAAEEGEPAPACYADGRPALYGFVGRTGPGTSRMVVDNFAASDI